MLNKKLVSDFLCSAFYKDAEIFKQYIHPKIQVNWNSSDGFVKLDYNGFYEMTQNMGKSFNELTPEFSHIFCEEDKVCVRFTYHVETLEHSETIALAHFFSIWEIKDDKLYKAYLMSQPADETTENLFSYIES